MLKRGRTPRLLHVARTHRVNLHFAQQAMEDPAYRPRYIKSANQIADMFTKGSHTAVLWYDLLERSQLQTQKNFRTLTGGTIQQALQTAAQAIKAALVPDVADGTTTTLEVA